MLATTNETLGDYSKIVQNIEMCLTSVGFIKRPMGGADDEDLNDKPGDDELSLNDVEGLLT